MALALGEVIEVFPVEGLLVHVKASIGNWSFKDWNIVGVQMYIWRL